MPELWIDLRRSCAVELVRSGSHWAVSFSPRLQGPWVRTRFAALLHASHAMHLRGKDCEWRRVEEGSDRLYYRRPRRRA